MKLISNNKFSIFFGFLYVLIFMSCHDDFADSTPISETRIDPISEYVQSNVRGIVSSKLGEPIVGAEVQLGEDVIITDSDGLFRFEKVTTKSNGDLLSIKKPGFISKYKVIYPEANASLGLDMVMTSRQLIGTHNSSESGTYDIEGGGSISFPANAIRNSTGEIYNGNVNMYVYWIDAESSEVVSDMPGDLSGINMNGQAVQLASYGMYYVELESENGEALNLAEGFKSILKFPLSSSQLASANDEIPLWYFDEVNGKWIEEGKATKQGDFFVGEVSHFSFWNCDVPYDLVNMEGRLIDSFGDPIQSWQIKIFLNNSTISSSGFTNSNGVFSGKIPKNELLKIIIEDCGEIVIEEEIGPFANDIDLGDFVLQKVNYKLSGNVISCIPDQNDQIYAIYNIGGTTKSNVISIEPDGSFTAHIEACIVDEVSIKFINPVDFSSSETIVAQFTNSEAVIEDVQLCGGEGSYITFESEDGITTISLEDGGFHRVLNEGKYRLDEDFELNGVNSFLKIDVNSLQPGIYTYPDVSFFIKSSNMDIDISKDNTNAELEVISAGELDGYFYATFKDFEDTFNNELVSGTIRIKVIEQYNSGTISGKTWVDDNGDGIRGVSENDFIAFTNLALVENLDAILSGSGHKISASAQIENDGTYKFTGLQPNKEYFLVHSDFLYNSTLTLLNQGGDIILDNDFYLEPRFNDMFAVTSAIFIADGANVENIDLGVLPSNSFFITGSFIDPCQDFVTFEWQIIGGYPPFDFELSNGDSFTGIQNNNISFDIIKPNIFTVTITDAAGVSISQDVDPKISNNSVKGNIWLDSDVGIVNSYDDVEPLQPDITVELFDKYGLCETTVSTILGFEFNHVSRGEAYIVVTLPPGHSFVEQGVGPNPSEVNANGRSMSFEFTGCDDKSEILVGIRKN